MCKQELSSAQASCTLTLRDHSQFPRPKALLPARFPTTCTYQCQSMSPSRTCFHFAGFKVKAFVGDRQAVAFESDSVARVGEGVQREKPKRKARRDQAS